MVFLLWLLWAGAPVEAAQPAAAAALSTGTEEVYLQRLLAVEANWLPRLLADRVEDWFTETPQTLAARRARAETLSWEMEAEVMALAAPPGAKRAEEAILAWPRYLRGQRWGAQSEELLTLHAARPVTTAQRDRLEQILQDEARMLQAFEIARAAALRALVGSGRLPRLPSAEPVLSPHFAHPDLPPAGSALSAAQWVAYPRAHAEQASSMSARKDAVLSEWIQALNGGIESARAMQPVLQRRMEDLSREAAAMTPWEGDAALVVNLKIQLAEMDELIGPEADGYFALVDRHRVKRGEYEKAGLYIYRVNTVRDRTAAFHREVAAFQSRWGVEAYLAWVAAHPPPEP